MSTLYDKLYTMKSWLKIGLFCTVCLAFIGCDRVTKDQARERLPYNETLSYFHDFVRLEYVENTGAALNLGDQLSRTASFWLLSILPLTFLLGLFAYTVRKSKEMSLPKMMALALIFAGGVGNIIDRLLFDRHVTDFLNIGVPGLRTAIFNFADLYITVGVIVLFVFYRRRNYPLAG